jgi:MPBQ/MSBQ methyltransferase
LAISNDEIPSCTFCPPKKNFIKAKSDFIDEMLQFVSLKSSPELRTLDVGCGIGGTTRYLAKSFGSNATVTGITLSDAQAERARTLSVSQNVTNTIFEVMDAQKMTFPDNSFDLVWACESGEHIPDKRTFINEMVRVLKPGGKLVVATWCRRDHTERPFTADEQRMLSFLESEWTHPHFISLKEYENLLGDSHDLVDIKIENWTINTITSWLHSLWVGIFDPIPVLRNPKLWKKCFRDGLTLLRMHKSFRSGLMQYGMMTATKRLPSLEGLTGKTVSTSTVPVHPKKPYEN